MIRHYKAIRARMLEMDIDSGYLAKKLGLSKAAISAKLTQKTPWRAGEMHTMCKVLKIPLEEALIKYFPASEAEIPSLTHKEEIEQPAKPTQFRVV